MSSAQLALVSCPVGSAEALAQTLIEAGVAACVNLLPQIRSFYRWDGQLRHDEESLLLIKTTAARFEALRREVIAHHPYELPEVIAVDIAAGHPPYLEWIARCVSLPA